MSLLRLSHEFTKRISLFVRQMDYALEWTSLEAGHALYRSAVKHILTKPHYDKVKLLKFTILIMVKSTYLI